MNEWYEKSGNHGNIAISTRIRLARNISKYPFPCRLSVKDKNIVLEEIKKALSNTCFEPYNFECIKLSDVSKIFSNSLMERHLISPEFLKSCKSKAVFLSGDKNISIMINEEDHIRLQVLHEGLDFDIAYELADKIDDKLNEILKFAFNDKLGYLTQCPTNLGTGMRASVMLHLPALKRCGIIQKISSSLIKLGLTIRGLYGEGSEFEGDLYQISNQVTLGISEKTALKNLNDMTLQLMNQEQNCRKELLKDIKTVDMIYRSVGVLKTACVLTKEESMKLLSNVRLGLSMDLLKNISYDLLNKITVNIQPNVLMSNENKELLPLQRDKKRANELNQVFENVILLKD